MASVKALLYTHKTLKNGEHPILIQIIKDRKRKTISLGYSCPAKLWDFENGQPLKKHPNFKELDLLIDRKKAEAKTLVLNLENEKRDFTLSEFENKYRNRGKKITVLKFIDSLIENLKRSSKIGNSVVYKDLKRVLTIFRKGIDFSFSDIDQSFLRQLEQHFRESNLKDTSISVYFRTLRSVYNKAVKEGFAKKSDYPFEEYKISHFNTSTVKRAISIEDIKKIVEFKTIEGSTLFHSKNYFLFSFYAMGMNFYDLAKLEWSSISYDRIYYTRAKTGKNYNFKILQPALEILEYYKSSKVDSYVFPILEKDIHNTPSSIDNRIKKIRKQLNSDLKEIAKEIGISTSITSYVARHSWATILKRSGVSTSVISEGLGHKTEQTTQIYLDSFENETMDKANEILLSL